MKVKNIVFSGFAAAVMLNAGVADAAPQIASKKYVDDKVTNTIETSITSDTGAIKTALDTKADKLTGAEIKEGNIATIDANGNYVAGNVAASTLITESNINEKIAGALEGNESVTEIITKVVENGDVVSGAIDSSVTGGTIKDALDTKADKITVTAEQAGNVATVNAQGQYEVSTVKMTDVATNTSVANAIAGAVTADGALKTALDSKADATAVYTKEETNAKIVDLAIPQPEGACAAESGRCVLSVDTTGKSLMWLNITDPLDSTGGTGAGE